MGHGAGNGLTGSSHSATRPRKRLRFCKSRSALQSSPL